MVPVSERYSRWQWVVILVIIGALTTTACSAQLPTTQTPSAKPASASGAPPIPEIPRQTVRFAHAPYIDHSQGIIGLEKGWFKEVGIEFAPPPNGETKLPSGQFQDALQKGTIDAASSSAAFTLPGLKQFPDVRMFSISTRFEGWGILADSKAGLKTYGDFVKSGASRSDAIKQTLAQMKGKRWVHPGFPATLLAVQVLMGLGGLTDKDVQRIAVPDNAQLVPMMRTGQADFFLGDGPSRAVLESSGFSSILNVSDLLEGTKASADSPEMNLVFYDGWLTTTKYWKENHDTVLRLASVQFRIADLITKNPDEALAIHVPFLNSVSGGTLTKEQAKTIYDSIDPFLTWEAQKPIFTDPNSPWYYTYELDVRIKALVDTGVYKAGEIKPESVTIAPDVYKELAALKLQAETTLTEVEAELQRAKQANKSLQQTEQLVARAKAFHAAYDFLDAQRFAAAAREWAAYEAQR